MSTLVVSNISDGTTTVGASYVTNGSAKAWCTFQGTGTAAIKDSLNVASLTDVGTANYTMSFTNSLANTNYNIQYTTHGTGSYSDWTRSCWYNYNDKLTTSYHVESTDETDAWYDPLEASALIHGDLA